MADRSIVVRMRAEISDFKAQMAAAGTAAKQAGKDVESTAVVASTAMGRMVQSATVHRQAWTTTGLALTAFGSAVTLALAGTVKAAIDWESAWAGVTKTVDGTPEQLAAVEQGLRDLAKTLPATHAEIAGVAEAAGQLGIQAGSVVAFTKVMVDLGETTNLTADEAATSIAQLMNIMQTAPDDVDNLGAALVALGNNGASTERDIIQMSQRIAAAGAIVGLTEADVMGFANAIASLGIEVESGGTAISRVMTDMSKAVSVGGADLELFAQTAGMSAADFAAAFKADPADAIATFIEGLGQIKDAGGDVFTVLSDLGMSDIRVSNALLSMAGAGDLLRESLELGSQAWEDNTALVIEAEKRYETAAAKIEIARNTIYDAGITIGQSLAPAVAGMAESVASIAQAFGGLPEPIQRSLGVMGGIVGVSSLVAGGFLMLFPRIVDTMNAFKDLNINGSKVPGVLGKIGGAFALISLAALIQQMEQVQGRADVATVETEALAKALSSLADGAKEIPDLGDIFEHDNALPMFRQEITTTEDALASFADSAQQALGSGFADQLERFLGDGGVSRFGEQVKQLDFAFAAMVSSGNVDAAVTAFEAFTDAAAAQGVDVGELTAMFPGYTEALAANTEEQKVAAEAQKATADAAALTENTYTNLVRGTAELTDAQQALIDTVRGVAAAFVDPLTAYQAVIDANTQIAQSTADATASAEDSWETYYDGVTVSLESWIQELESQKVALDDWATNMVLLSGRVSDGLLQTLAEMGPEGAALVADLVNSSGDEIARLETIFGTGAQSAVDTMATTLLTSGPVIAAASAQLGAGAAAEIAAKLAAGTSTVEQIIAEYGLVIEGYVPVVTVETETETAIANLHAVVAASEQVDSCTPNVGTSTTGTPEAITNLHAVVAAADRANASDPNVDTSTTNVPSVLTALGSVWSSAMNIPGGRNTNVTTSGTDRASSSIRGVRDTLATLHDKTVTVTVVTKGYSGVVPKGAEGGLIAEGVIARGYAGGGMIPGTPPADPMVDNVLARGPGGMFAIRSGEFVSTQLATARNYAALVAGNRGATLAAVGYAGGGGVGAAAGGGSFGNIAVVVRAVLQGLSIRIDETNYFAQSAAAHIELALAQQGA